MTRYPIVARKIRSWVAILFFYDFSIDITPVLLYNRYIKDVKNAHRTQRKDFPYRETEK